MKKSACEEEKEAEVSKFWQGLDIQAGGHDERYIFKTA
jgi:hypothetical protein